MDKLKSAFTPRPGGLSPSSRLSLMLLGTPVSPGAKAAEEFFAKLEANPRTTPPRVIACGPGMLGYRPERDPLVTGYDAAKRAAQLAREAKKAQAPA